MVETKNSSVREWRPIPIDGFNGYYDVSDDGLIRSHDRTITNSAGVTIHLNGRVLKPRLDAYGYVIYDLSVDGHRITVKAHRMVAMAFIQKVDGKDDINHIDGNKENNAVTNLEWCTKKENSIHARDHRLMHIPSKDEVSKGLSIRADNFRTRRYQNPYGFKPIEGYEDYSIDNAGHVFSRVSGNISKVDPEKDGASILLGRYDANGKRVYKRVLIKNLKPDVVCVNAQR